MDRKNTVEVKCLFFCSSVLQVGLHAHLFSNGRPKWLVILKSKVLMLFYPIIMFLFNLLLLDLYGKKLGSSIHTFGGSYHFP